MDKIIPEMSHPTSVCPHPELWHAYDDMATELEVLEFLNALVVMLKPRVAIETGAYHGHGTVAIASALHQNDFGVLYTCDLGQREVIATKTQLAEAGLDCRVIVTQASGVDMITQIGNRVDFAFLDSGPDEVRCHELRALYPKLASGGVVAIHDSGIQGFLREKWLGPLLRELGMQYIFFDTPRGLCLCRKTPEIYP